MIDATYLDDLVANATRHLIGDEVLLAATHSESTVFARFNDARVRQAGTIDQSSIDLDLIEGLRHTQAGLRLSGDAASDRVRVVAAIERLREQRALVPDDPHLIINTDVTSTQFVGDDDLPPSDDALAAITRGAVGKDLVGIYTAGSVASGFANSLGQRNWFQTSTFNFDWTFYLQADKAVKNSYAGHSWDEQVFGRKLSDANAKLDALARPAITLAPGEYRAYLTPAALLEVVELLSWGSFGARAQRTSQSALLRLLTGEGELHPSVRISEDTANGVAPDFQEQGFLRPSEVVLIEHGKPVDALVSPRSAVEFDIEPNGAAGDESPRSLAIGPGDLEADDVLGRLGTGLHVGNLWYTNFSDRPACRVTGMTRFATFWVEGGGIVAPVNVLRFDDSIYNLLGSRLAGLTSEAEFVFDNSTYEQRTSASVKLPGALVDAMRFTL
ncbi:MAG: metallopeptidase TldD-related protein [Actinomycetota bacterium]|nr:metallopeptidase TldD-related protein [Actinomycetota bacterium]